ncbi:FKBP-type peptidyl-prolyl cis-trans isomerase [Novosphingobium sp. FKTRR1]|uniref:FKBP-type peptidyl-prolyl cis-trans isomerase n=1 Tax=unclassified Novosphingobium TaxID=2644732 RepID=UPI001CF080F1|nr:FKBP-type peptidyl-prolyl cis-trans isomerase [Novosphingobium sp. FKTRR1]
MSEITRVPLQPVAKGSLTKLWIGVALALSLGGAVAYGSRTRSLEIDTIKVGQGAKPGLGDVVLVNYVGTLANGKEFDRGEKVAMPVEGVIPGFSKGLQQMQRGGKYKIVIPAALGYGAEEKKNPQTGEVVIPANSELTFTVELVDFKNRAEIEQQRRLIQQMQQQMGAGQGAPGGAMPGMPGAGGPEGAPQQ